MCSISGWGQDGPLRELPGHDLNYAALSGVAHQMGGLSNLPMADLLGGTMGAVMALLAALFDAARTGRGRHVDVAMADAVLAHAVLPLAALNEHGQVPEPGRGTLTGGLACYGLYPTADGRQLAVGALEAKFWDALCERIGRPDLQPLHRRADAATQAHVKGELTALFQSQPLAHWTALFDGVPACVTPVLRLDEALAHPHFQARGMAQVMASDEASASARQLGPAVRMSGYTPEPPRPAPAQGEHSEALLVEAGYDAAAIAALRAQGVIGAARAPQGADAGA
jgi:crotonobetainyl-CoA:carnitine CoA-transferase CaiB-like acyl-CoA transferase